MIADKIIIRHSGCIGEYQLFHGISLNKFKDDEVFYPEYLFYVGSCMLDQVKSLYDGDNVISQYKLVELSDFVIHNNKIVKARCMSKEMVDLWVSRPSVIGKIPSLGETIAKFSGIAEVSGKVQRKTT